MAVCPVGIHYPHLGFPVFFGHERDAPASVNPHGFVFRIRGGGEAAHVAAVGVHHIKLVVGFVLLHALIAHAIENPGAVGRYFRVAYASKRLERLDVENAVGRFEIGLVDKLLAIVAAA